MRPLPYIIGTEAFLDSPHVGLGNGADGLDMMSQHGQTNQQSMHGQDESSRLSFDEVKSYSFPISYSLLLQ
jgi:hypothetical protein